MSIVLPDYQILTEGVYGKAGTTVCEIDLTNIVTIRRYFIPGPEEIAAHLQQASRRLKDSAFTPIQGSIEDKIRGASFELRNTFSGDTKKAAELVKNNLPEGYYYSAHHLGITYSLFPTEFIEQNSEGRNINWYDYASCLKFENQFAGKLWFFTVKYSDFDKKFVEKLKEAVSQNFKKVNTDIVKESMNVLEKVYANVSDWNNYQELIDVSSSELETVSDDVLDEITKNIEKRIDEALAARLVLGKAFAGRK